MRRYADTQARIVSSVAELSQVGALPLAAVVASPLFGRGGEVCSLYVYGNAAYICICVAMHLGGSGVGAVGGGGAARYAVYLLY
jgi:hypothetical protein